MRASSLFDHLVGAGEDSSRDNQPKLFGGFQIENKF
jgi:hypothetical protein